MTKKLKSGKISYTAFNMPEEIAAMSKEELEEKIRAFAFEPFCEEDIMDMKKGFCDCMNYEDSDKFNHALQGSFLVYGIRYDEYKYQKNVMEMRLRKMCYDRDIDPDTLNSQNRNEMLGVIKQDMKEKMIPHTNVFDLILDYGARSTTDNTGIRRIYILSHKQHDVMMTMDLFNRALGVEIMPENFATEL